MGKFKLEKQYRLPTHDYSSEGYYFVTICTKNREEFFGEIQNEIMGLNEIGRMTAKFWQEISNHFNNVELDEWVVMPNHVHGIIGIMENNKPTVGSSHGVILRNNGFNKPIFNQFGKTIPNSISSIINHFKGAVTRWCRANECQNFAWQSRFHDRVIRNDEELNRIRLYIINNPQKWE